MFITRGKVIAVFKTSYLFTEWKILKKKEVLITENVFLKMEFRGAESRLLPHRTAYK